MKNLFLIFVIIFFTYSLNAQISFEPEEMTTSKKKIKTTESINGRITVNSDTTEIELNIGGLNYKEKIGRLRLFNDFGDCKVYSYEQEDGTLVLQIVNNLLYCVTFHTKNHRLQFK
jgi:hypothetical protein